MLHPSCEFQVSADGEDDGDDNSAESGDNDEGDDAEVCVAVGLEVLINISVYAPHAAYGHYAHMRTYRACGCDFVSGRLR